MENIWGIKTSRIALPDERLSYNDWVQKLKVSSNYRNNIDDSAYFLNKQYDFSKFKTNKNEPTNTGA